MRPLFLLVVCLCLDKLFRFCCGFPRCLHESIPFAPGLTVLASVYVVLHMRDGVQNSCRAWALS